MFQSNINVKLVVYQLLSEEDDSDSLLESESLSLDSDLHITKKQTNSHTIQSEHLDCVKSTCT